MADSRPMLIGKVALGGTWFHISPPKVDEFEKWILLIRDPIDRIKSFYMYDHPANFEWRTDRFGWPIKSEKAAELFGCYPSLDKLCTEGLISWESGMSDCHDLAHMSIPPFGSGWLTGLQHVRWNFYRYFHELLKQRKSKTLVAIRSEYMEYDMNRINQQFGDERKIQSIARISHWENSSYPMKDRFISPEGMVNLCAQLCREIQIYKQILRNATNMGPVAYGQSMNQLRRNCPIQVESETCPTRVKSPDQFEKHMQSLLVEEVTQLARDKEAIRLQSLMDQGREGSEGKKEKLQSLMKPEARKKTNFGFIEIGLGGGREVWAMLKRKGSDSVLAKKLEQGAWFATEDPDISKFDTWVIMLKDPIDRIQQWWVHDHPLNRQYRKFDDLTDLLPHQLVGRKTLFDCFDSLDNFTTVGLRPTSNDQSSWDECQKVARRAMPKVGHGIVASMNTLNFNYQRMFKDLLDQRKEKNIFVIRSRTVKNDLDWLEMLFGGGAQFRDIKPRFLEWTTEELPVRQRQISAAGMENLCNHLCQEIQTYKKLLLYALNLKEKAYAEAVDKIQLSCPVQAELDFDGCV